MLGVWLEGGAVQLRDDLAMPDPPAGEALVQVLRAGICNTDLELIKGYYPFTGILGHEFVGRVAAGAKEWVGRRVVGEINAVCGGCTACLAGRRHHCLQRTVLGIVGRDGAFAQYLCLPEENLHVVPEGISDDAATFVEPLAAALEIQQQVSIRPQDRVLVVGAGKLGQLIARTLALTGCALAVASRRAEKRALLEGAGICAVPTDGVVEGGYDLVVECSGNSAGFALGRRAVRGGGTMVLKSTYKGNLSLDASALVVDEITVVGSRCGPFAPALRLLQQGRVEVEPLIAERLPLKAAKTALQRAQTPGTLKVLLTIEE